MWQPRAITIREAERADLLDIYQIEQASFPQPWPYHAFASFLTEPGFLVATTPPRSLTGDPDPITGFILATTEPAHGHRIGHIKDLAVHPDYRHNGVGSRLLERALMTLNTTGARHVKLEVRRSNQHARSLYNRYGFTLAHVHEQYYDDGEDALVLVTDINTNAD